MQNYLTKYVSVIICEIIIHLLVTVQNNIEPLTKK